jgi:SnoaL-like domain
VDLPQAVRDAAETSAITQLILKERESRDLGRWEDLRDCFHADSQIRISWFRGNGADFVKRSIDMARRNVLAKHRLSPIRVVLACERAVATMSAIIEIPVELEGAAMNLLSYTRFVYRAGRREGTWRIFSFDAIYLRDELTPAIPGHSIAIDPDELRPFRPAYRLLSYVLSKQGYAADTELAGDDRPGSVGALMRGIFAWAGIGPGVKSD